MDKAKDWLSQFVGRVIWNALEKGIKGEGALADAVAIFIKDMEGAPTHYHVVGYMQAIALRPEQVRLDKNTVLRRCNPSDFEHEEPPGFTYGIFSGLRVPIVPRSASAILELKLEAKDQFEVMSEVEVGTAVLRLFKVGAVHYEICKGSAKTILHFLGEWRTGKILQSPMREPSYVIAEGEVEPLKRFWPKMKSIISLEFARGTLEKMDHVAIAYQRYSDALLQDGMIERRLTTAVMGLEALYLRAEERQELSYRLCIRAAKILGMLEYDTLEVSSALKEAYGMRSIFVHGSQLEGGKRKLAERLFVKVLEHLRASIIAFMLLKPSVGKERLIQLTDNAFLSEGAVTKLKDLLTQVTDYVRVPSE